MPFLVHRTRDELAFFAVEIFHNGEILTFFQNAESVEMPHFYPWIKTYRKPVSLENRFRPFNCGNPRFSLFFRYMPEIVFLGVYEEHYVLKIVFKAEIQYAFNSFFFVKFGNNLYSQTVQILSFIHRYTPIVSQ